MGNLRFPYFSHSCIHSLFSAPPPQNKTHNLSFMFYTVKAVIFRILTLHVFVVTAVTTKT